MHDVPMTTTESTPTTTTDPLAEAIHALAARDTDRATEANSVGFNGSDTGFGNRLAAIPPSRWTNANRREAWVMLRKYRKQLGAYGIDYDSIPEPPMVNGGGSRTTWKPGAFSVSIVNGRFAMKSAYNPALVEAQKAIPGRAWDGERNTFPITSATQVSALLEANSDIAWEISAEAQEALAAAPKESREELAAKVTVTLKGEAYIVDFPYDREMVEQIKSIAARRWDGQRRLNLVAATALGSAELQDFLAAHAPIRYRDGAKERIETLAQEGRKLINDRLQMAELSSASEATVEIPGLGGELRPFQQAGVEYVLRAAGRSFISDEPGLGKTVQALAALQARDNFPAIIICPASVKYSWRDHVQGPVAGAPEGWLPGKRVVMLSGRTPDPEVFGSPARDRSDLVVVANYDILEAWLPVLLDLKPQAVVWDESHMLKSKKAARTKAALELAKAIPADGLVLNLTGTAILNRPIELTSQLELIGRLEDLGGWWNFAKRYCGAYKDTWGWHFDGATHLDELNEKLRGSCFIRRMKRDVMKELPEKQIARVSVELSNAKEYQRAEADTIGFLIAEVEADREFAAEIEGLPEDEKRARLSGRQISKVEAAQRAEHLVRLNALRRVCAKGKIKPAVEWIKDFLEGSEEKLIVFAQHIEIQHALLKEFPDAAHIFGEDGAEVRNTNVQRFQNDPSCRLIICSLKAAGIGITLTAASNVLTLEYDWTPATHDQAEDRAHRMGQEGNVTCWYLCADNTIDSDMHDLIEQKRKVIVAATDGGEPDRQVSIMGDLEARLIARGR